MNYPKGMQNLISILEGVAQNMTDKTVEANLKRLKPPYSTRKDLVEARELDNIVRSDRIDKHIKYAVVQAVLSGKSLNETKQLYQEELNTRIDL